MPKKFRHASAGAASVVGLTLLGFLVVSFVLGTTAVVRNSFDIRQRAQALYPDYHTCVQNSECASNNCSYYQGGTRVCLPQDTPQPSSSTFYMRCSGTQCVQTTNPNLGISCLDHEDCRIPEGAFCVGTDYRGQQDIQVPVGSFITGLDGNCYTCQVTGDFNTTSGVCPGTPCISPGNEVSQTLPCCQNNRYTNGSKNYCGPQPQPTTTPDPSPQLFSHCQGTQCVQTTNRYGIDCSGNYDCSNLTNGENCTEDIQCTSRVCSFNNYRDYWGTCKSAIASPTLGPPYDLGYTCQTNADCRSEYCAPSLNGRNACQSQPYCPIRCRNGCFANDNNHDGSLDCRPYCDNSANHCQYGCTLETSTGGVCRESPPTCSYICAQGCENSDRDNDGFLDCKPYCNYSECQRGCLRETPLGGVCQIACAATSFNGELVFLGLGESITNSSGNCATCREDGNTNIANGRCAQDYADDYCIEDGYLSDPNGIVACCSDTSHRVPGTSLNRCGANFSTCPDECINGCDSSTGECLSYCDDSRVCAYGCIPDQGGGICEQRECWRAELDDMSCLLTDCTSPSGNYFPNETECENYVTSLCPAGYVSRGHPSMTNCIQEGPPRNDCYQCLQYEAVDCWTTDQSSNGSAYCAYQARPQNECQFPQQSDCENFIRNYCNGGTPSWEFDASQCASSLVNANGCMMCDCASGSVPRQLLAQFQCPSWTETQTGCFVCAPQSSPPAPPFTAVSIFENIGNAIGSFFQGILSLF